MKKTKMPPPWATHKVSLWGVRCYWNCETDDLWGVNWLCDHLIIPVSRIHSFFYFLTEAVFPWIDIVDGFPLRVIERYRDRKGG